MTETTTTSWRRETRVTYEPIELTDTARGVLLRAWQRMAEINDRMFDMGTWFRWHYDENGNLPDDEEGKKHWECGYAACLAGTIAIVEHPDIWDEISCEGVDDFLGTGKSATVGSIALGALTECDPWRADMAHPLWLLFFVSNWPDEFREGAMPYRTEREHALELIDAVLYGRIDQEVTTEVTVEADGEEWDYSRSVKLHLIAD